MAKTDSASEHALKITTSILDDLSTRYFKFSKMHKEAEDVELLIKIASSIGYQIQTLTGLQKAYDFDKRLKHVELKIASIPAEQLVSLWK